jgi:ribosome maturation factor RimP
MASQKVHDTVLPVVEDLGLGLYDLELAGGVLRVLVDRDGGVDIDVIAKASRALSAALDEADPIEGRYTLEVSSPGLERPLRTAAHWAGAVGDAVTVKTVPGLDGPRRLTGRVLGVTDDAVDLALDDPAGETRTVAFTDIERARTVFVWGPSPKPGKAGAPRAAVSAGDRTPDPEVDV